MATTFTLSELLEFFTPAIALAGPTGEVEVSARSLDNMHVRARRDEHVWARLFPGAGSKCLKFLNESTFSGKALADALEQVVRRAIPTFVGVTLASSGCLWIDATDASYAVFRVVVEPVDAAALAG
jgi:hypothetical protein